MATLNWLHLTDLHLGMKGFSDLWPNVEHCFFNDLKYLAKEAGPIDLVLFTGDLTQSGLSEEFDEVNRFLKRLWKHFRETNCEPKFLAVPGNHDLERPNRKGNAALLSLMNLWEKKDVQEDFWETSDSSYRKLVAKAFQNYTQWWENIPVPKVEKYSLGILPGDFSAAFEKEGIKLGIVGLNSSFLQLQRDDREGKLSVNVQQFHGACDGNGPNWTKNHDVCFLMTHHPPDWFTAEGKDQIHTEIHAPPERFALHLLGHMHESSLTSLSTGSSRSRRILQGCSLFGMEGWGDAKKERIHGYSLGQLEINESKSELRIYPRRATKQKNVGWKIDRDSQNFSLPKGKDATEAFPIDLLRSRSNVLSIHSHSQSKNVVQRQTSLNENIQNIEKELAAEEEHKQKVFSGKNVDMVTDNSIKSKIPRNKNSRDKLLNSINELNVVLKYTNSLINLFSQDILYDEHFENLMNTPFMSDDNLSYELERYSFSHQIWLSEVDSSRDLSSNLNINLSQVSQEINWLRSLDQSSDDYRNHLKAVKEILGLAQSKAEKLKRLYQKFLFKLASQG